jgi:CHAT domain-containing protein
MINPRIFSLLFSMLFVFSLLLLPRVSSQASGSESAIRFAQSDSQTLVLESNKPVERELAGGAFHSYQLTLASGQYLHIIVMQKGIDIVATLLAPNGDKIVEMDSPNGTDGPEHVWAIAETAGSFRLEVRSLEKEAPKGKYLVTLAELRAATAEDRKRVMAENVYAEAELLLGQGTAQSLTQAIESYQKALLLWRELKQSQREAATLNNISFAYGSLSDFRKELEYQEQALAIRRAIGDQAGIGDSLHSIGSATASLGEMRKGIDYYLQAVAIFNQLGDRGSEARTLWNVGAVYNALHDTPQALHYLQQALALSRTAGARRVEGNTLVSIGVCYQDLGEYQTALDYYTQARAINSQLRDKNLEGAVFGHIGYLYAFLKDYPKSLENLNQSLTMFREAGDRYAETALLSSIGEVYQSLKEYPKALAYHQQVLALSRAIGSPQGEAGALNHIGELHSLQGEHQKAIDFLNQALARHQAMANGEGETLSLLYLAQTYQRLGNLQEAEARLKVVLGRYDALRETKSQDQSHRATFFAAILPIYESYMDLLMQLHAADPKAGYDLEALAVSERTRARSLLDLLKESRVDIRQGVDTQLLDRERRLNELIAAKQDKMTEMLSRRHSEAQKVAAEKEVAALLIDRQQAQAEIRQRNPHYAALTEPRTLKAQEIQQTLLDPDTLLLEYAFGKEQVYLWLVSNTSVKSFTLARRQEVEDASRRVYELLLARQNNKALPEAELRASIAEADTRFQNEAAALSRQLLGPVASQLGSKRLLIVAPGALQYLPFAALPDPVAGSQSPVAGNSASSNRPPAADDRPLIVDHEIITLPSTSVLAELRREGRQRLAPSKTVAILADPVFSRDDPRVGAGVQGASQQKSSSKSRSRSRSQTRTLASLLPELAVDLKSAARGNAPVYRAAPARLPFSREEAEAIFAIAPKNSSLKALDFDASRAAITNTDLSHYRILHFATHGILNTEQPDLSGLLLSLVDGTGQPQNGFLRLHEIYNLKLNADLVVLSACQTALGKEVRGEGLIGLTRGFMYAGAPRVVASLWQVDDLATAELMKRFYKGVLEEGLPAGAALRAAQLEIGKRKRWQSPYYWAAFTLQGEWK